MALSIEKRKVDGTVEIRHPSGATTRQESTVAEVASDRPMANVGYQISFTKNLGNYESTKVTVTLHMPCPPTAQDIDETFARIEKWVDGRMGEITQKMSG